MHVAGRQVNHVTGLQGKMVQKKGNEDAGISGEGFIDVHHGGQRFAVRLQGCAGGQDGDYLVDGVGDAGATLDESAEGCFQGCRLIRLAEICDDAFDDIGNVHCRGIKDVGQVPKDVLGLSR